MRCSAMHRGKLIFPELIGSASQVSHERLLCEKIVNFVEVEVISHEIEVYMHWTPWHNSRYNRDSCRRSRTNTDVGSINRLKCFGTIRFASTKRQPILHHRANIIAPKAQSVSIYNLTLLAQICFYFLGSYKVLHFHTPSLRAKYQVF